MGAPPALLVMESAARPGPELRELLGAKRAARVERLLVRRAMEWRGALGVGPVWVADDDEAVPDALARVFAESGGDGPLVVVWPVLPCWRAEHAFAVVDDLAAGCEASVAPVFDHGLYMLALARPIPAVLSLPGETWDSPNATGLVLAPINEAGAQVGLVRPERALRRTGDVRAALADPLLDDELRELLAG